MEILGKVRNCLRINRQTNSKYKEGLDEKDDGVYYEEEIHPGSKLWLFLLFLSSAVIITKYVGDYNIKVNPIYEHLLSLNSLPSLCYDIVSNIFIYVWTLMYRFQWILMPSFFASVFVLFSWIVLYKDSAVPGVSPPTPFSPPRFRIHCVRSMDFSYALTGIFGFLIFVRLLYQNLRYAD